MASTLANGLRHYYRREGDRELPTLVLAHPIGFDHGLWDRVVPALCDKFHVIRYDLRGHGGSEGTTKPYSVDLLAQDALSLLDALEVGAFSFVGTSLGGLVGLQLAQVVPQRMRSLVVANASARLPLPAEEWNKRIALAEESGTASFIEGMTQRMFTPDFVNSSNPAFHTLLESFRAINPVMYAAAMAALRDADLGPRLADVRVPTLVIAAEKDGAVPRDHMQRIADGIPGARLVVLPGGHLSAVESPSAFAAEVAAFAR